jgi:LmbE family N-acetylglucosaminyl deacetylase
MLRPRPSGFSEIGRRASEIEGRRQEEGRMDELGTILGVWAHPDDEAYLTAGIMARAVRNGSRVVCVTATRGEGGSMDEEKWPPESMGEVRTKELGRSLQILGVDEHVWLDMRTSTWTPACRTRGYESASASRRGRPARTRSSRSGPTG